MESTENAEKVAVFDKHRPRLFGIAYRMLGTRDDAEDVLQEAYIRLHSARLAEIEVPEAWLVTVVTRLSIDRLRRETAARETYIGPWLPEPLMMIDPARSPETEAEIASDISVAFMVLLERLSPIERAVFLLHDVFDFAHAEIARIVAKSEVAVRQIVSRARTRVQSGRRRFVADEASRSDLIKKFIRASYAGDEVALMSVFADDVVLMSDGGGKVHAARRIVSGSNRLVRVFTLAISRAGELSAYMVDLNGEMSIVEYAGGVPVAATCFVTDGGKIRAIYRVMNTDKLKAFENTEEKLIADKVSQMTASTRLNL